MAKPRVHNEYFMPLVKTSCPCGKKHARVFAWGEYHCARWSTVDHFCQDCFATRVLPRLTSHAHGCGCSFSFNARSGYNIPAWIAMPPVSCAA
jgi:hypothetical protein